MQGEGLVQPFLQTAGRRLIAILQLAMERLEGGAGAEGKRINMPGEP